MSREKAKGSRFERAVADYMSARTGDPVDRRVLSGAKDRGDLSGLTFRGKRVTVEVKNCNRLEPAKWLDEVRDEKGNDDAEFGIVVAHRRGCGEGSMGRNYVLMDLDEFLAMKCGAHALMEDGDGRG